MRTIARAYASTRTASLMYVKKTRTTSVYDTYCLVHWNEENQSKTKNIRLGS